MREKIIFEGITDKNEEMKPQLILRASSRNPELYSTPFECEGRKRVVIVFSGAIEIDSSGNTIGESEIELAIELPEKVIDYLAVRNGSASISDNSW